MKRFSFDHQLLTATLMEKILLTILIAMAVSACSDDDDMSNNGMATIEMPITISIPAEGSVNPTDVGIDNEDASSQLFAPSLSEGSTRGPGDPGEAETFELPKYIYIYLVSTSTAGITKVFYKQKTLSSEDWKLSTSPDGNGHFSAQAGLYVYQGHLTLNLPLDRKEGRVYIAASPVELSEMKPAADEWDSAVDEWDSAEDVVNNVTFSSQGSTRAQLGNIYSSPYNLTRTVEGKKVYYGTIDDYTSLVPHIDMVLYHVATKLDLQWTIDEEVQGTKNWPVPAVGDEWSTLSGHDMRTTTDASSADYNKVFFSYIEARLLPKDNLPIFKPMNLQAGASLGTYDLAFLGQELATGQTDANGRKRYYQVLDSKYESMKYYGRSVIYAIPQRYADGNYYMHLKMLVNNYTTSDKTDEGYRSLLTQNDHATAGHHAYIKISHTDIKDKDDSSNPIFAPWVRATIHVTADNAQSLVTFSNAVTFPVIP